MVGRGIAEEEVVRASEDAEVDSNGAALGEIVLEWALSC